MGRRSGQLYEILTARAGKTPAGRSRRGGAGRASTPAGRGVERALAAGRGLLGKLDPGSRRAAPAASSGGGGGRGVGGRGVGGLSSGATTLLVAAVAGLLVGFAVGRWTGGENSAEASSGGELRRTVGGEGGIDPRTAQQPAWVSPEGGSGGENPVQLPPEEEFAVPSQFGFVLLGYPASEMEHAARIATWLRSQSFWDTRLRRMPHAATGQTFLAVVVYAPGPQADGLARELRELSAPDFAPLLQDALRQVEDRPRRLN